MAEAAAVHRPSSTPATSPRPWLFALAVFASAALVFTVQPMVTRLVLPKLGGSPAVWNTAMVFFQAALLAGYAYAHGLQRLPLRRQFVVHLGLLALGALFLPLRLTGLIGDPPPGAPVAWLLAALALSVGAPFAVLSATAPLVQAWWARMRGEEGGDPYGLYAASNLGSFAALLAYPAILEPLLALHVQTVLWTVAYGLFAAVIVALAWGGRASPDHAVVRAPESPPVAWKERLLWIALAAAPSSLMLGVTSHVATDVASAPLLWIAPLALYLLTFVVAFAAKPAIPKARMLMIQGVLAAVCTALLPFRTVEWSLLLTVHLATFFFTALLCHQILAERRPAADRLTEFYLLLSLGSVIGGALTALVAPVVFDVVREYPLVLIAVALARPWRGVPMSPARYAVFVASVDAGLLAAALFPILKANPEWLEVLPWKKAEAVSYGLVALGAAGAIVVRDRALFFTASLVAVSIGAHAVAGRYAWIESDRSFFGVLRVAEMKDPRLGSVKVLLHGSTLHGAQASDPAWVCRPMTYYAPTTPIGQAVRTIQARGPAKTVAVVGLGTGALASYKRAGDTWRYFEIDPTVAALSGPNGRQFSYVRRCAAGPVDIVLGDARLSLAKQPAGLYDLIVVDAFSSDSVPTHLLTREALAGYLRLVRPDGVVLLHLSNRNLEITTPAAAAIRDLGAAGLHQIYFEDPDAPLLADASTDALILARTPEALADFRASGRWREPPTSGGRAWTDDYVNIVGAIWRDCCEPPPRDGP